ncbi:hypothetical protein CQW23_28296 [Capsicum baccatum]|uniref:CCHC-type domain-containing protein n=1 Tax=Capsicum baccatum TaxID=33114 RepID=A0A2G2VG87_CAPBA|nr:hypothetical protein CQW23_28296 [Capsicum baccatum]
MASDSNFVQTTIPRFDGHYDHWSMLMENFLQSKKYYPIVEDGIDTPAVGEILTNAQKIEESKDIDELSLDELQNSLLVHEQKRNHSLTFEEQALKASTFVPSNFRRIGRGRGREDRGNKDGIRNFRANDDGKGRGKNFDKSKVECYRCHKFGHYQSECYTRLPSNKGKKSNFVESNETKTLLMSINTEEKPMQDVWYLDTGCSNHMSGSKSCFSSLNEGFHSKVNFGDCSTVDAMGKGDIKIKAKNGFEEIILNVLYVPALKSNVLSVRQLQEKGYSIFIGKDVCEIYSPTKGAIVVAKMNSKMLFPLNIESIQSCLKAKVKDPLWMWHFRYGHLGFGGLKTLQ